MKKNLLFVSLLLLIALLSSLDVYAFQDIDDNGVDVTFTIDYFEHKEIRKPAYYIEDDNQFGNLYDVINVNNTYDGLFNLGLLAEQGYKTLVVEVTMWVWEYQDGYQRIYFYDDTSTTTLLTGGIFEHGSGYTKEAPSQYTFYCEIPIDALHDNDFVIRYGSSGAFQNDWANSEVTVQLGASRETRKTVDVWKIVWDNSEHTTYTYTSLKQCR